MRFINNKVEELRLAGHVHLASMLKSWKSALVFAALCFVAVVEWHAPLRIVFWGKLFIAAVGLATWLTDAFYIRRHWELEK
jgi:hypothetical protein